MKNTFKTILLIIMASLTLTGCSLFKHNKKTEEGPVSKIETKVQWIYGGYNGSKTIQAGNLISNLKIDSNRLYYSWKVPESMAANALNSASPSTADLICCLFVKTSSGKIVGGKFEWISVTRKFRDLKNIYKGYNGWKVSDVPIKTDVWMCIVNPKTGKRTNFIHTTWTR